VNVDGDIVWWQVEMLGAVVIVGQVCVVVTSLCSGGQVCTCRASCVREQIMKEGCENSR
jgi:hypothetical protein